MTATTSHPLTVSAPAPLVARWPAPGSKSHTNRVLAAAALATGTSTLHHPLDAEDSRAMRAVVRGLGAHVDDADPGCWRVQGVGGRPTAPAQPLDARQSGTTLRFGAALASLAHTPVTLDGDAQLRRRPIGALTAALRALGADAADHDGHPPVTVGGGLDGGAVTVDARRSSQYPSALLLAAPHARAAVTVTAQGLGAPAYVELTAATLRAFGGAVSRLAEDRWWVAADGLDAAAVTVDPDASAAAHLLALAAAVPGTVTVDGAAPTDQPDAAVPDLLAAMGCDVVRADAAVTVTGPARLRPLTADLAALPDQITTLAALAALAEGTSHLSGVAVARGHETDRLAALAAELGKLGVHVEEEPDGLRIHGGTASGPAVLDPRDDHRLAMAFAALAARVPGVAVADPGCVAKTYPRFWADLAEGGLQVRRHDEEDPR